MSRRTEQMASTLLRALQEIITRGLQDPRVSGLITVTGLRVSEDKREATVMVSVLPADRQELTMHGLRAAVPHIRHQLGEMVDMRNTPNLSFKLDGSLKKQAGVIAAMSKVSEERDRTSTDGTVSFSKAMVSEEPAQDDSPLGTPFNSHKVKDRSGPSSRSDSRSMVPRVSTRRQSGAKNTVMKNSGSNNSLGERPATMKSGMRSEMKPGAKPLSKAGSKPGMKSEMKSGARSGVKPAAKSPMKSGGKKTDRPNSKPGEPRR